MQPRIGKWRSWLARCVRDAEVGCSSHLFPTKGWNRSNLFSYYLCNDMVKNIIFDFGGVLVDWNRHYLYDEYFKTDEARILFEKNTGIIGLTSLEMSNWFLDNICTLEWNAQMDGGKPLDVGTDELVALHPEWEKPVRMFFGNWIEMFHGAIDGMYEILVELKAAGYALYGLSNWAAATFDKYVGPNFPVFKLLEGMVVSGHEHCIKPEERIYRILLDRYGLEPSQCVFIDDSRANLEGAARLGIGTYQFTDACSFKAALPKILA